MEWKSVAELKALPSENRIGFCGIFLLRKADVRKTRTGSDFLILELGDKTGSFRANCWGDSSGFELLKGVPAGAIVEVEGQTDTYNDAFSPKLHKFALIDPESAAIDGYLDRLVASSPLDPQLLWEEIQEAVITIEPESLRTTVSLALEDHESLFRTSPAAISMHHAYRSGLLEHTTRMVRCAQALLSHYPEVHPGLTLAGIILHDMGKIFEYSQGLATGKTREGILQGHVVLGYRVARKAAMQSRLSPELTERLEHVILSHQGELEWGAAVKAATPEAVFVSMIDNLDAKMGMVQEALRTTPEDQEFSEYIPGLGAPVLNLKPEA